MRPRVIPAEDRADDDIVFCRPGSFNEAAGNPRGRPEGLESTFADLTAASMRPRVIPAEDALGAALDPPMDTASMRPRVIPAEDLHRPRDPSRRPGLQ